jgi:hypothetical protein
MKWRGTPIVLLSDLGTGIDKTKALCEADHSGAAFYSQQMLDYLSVESIRGLPIPTLPSFVQYLCKLHFSLSDDMHRIRLEQLVDGMNIDKEWSHKNLSDKAHVQYLLDLVNSKGDRMDDFSRKASELCRRREGRRIRYSYPWILVL